MSEKAGKAVAPLVPNRLPGATSIRSNIPTIGPQTIVTAHGTVETVEVPGVTSMLITRKGGAASVALLLYNTSPGATGGWLNQMSAENAREMGASLIRLANMADSESMQRETQ